ncbi:MAG: amidohydrolase family protein [Planctomycetes bacterium]|nr:amidohydrolase family protein [Planctomycetota bacterium]
MKTANVHTPINSDSAIAAEFWKMGHSPSCPVYDMHAHMGGWRSIYFPNGETEQMAESMRRAGVKMLCFAHHAALFCPDIGNAAAVRAVRRFPDCLRAYLSINPHYPEALKADLAGFDSQRDVFMGIKILADYHEVPLSDNRYRIPLEFADERSLPVLTHTWGGSQHDGAEQICMAAERHPNVRFLLAHSLHDRWNDAAEIAIRFPNVYLELTAVIGKRGAVETMAEKAGSSRMLYGTDLPWFDERNYIGALLSADISDEDRHNIFHRNAEKLLGISGE